MISNGDRGLVSELTDLGDDIVDTTTEITTVDEKMASPVVMKSEPTQKVYLEKSSECIRFFRNVFVKFIIVLYYTTTTTSNGRSKSYKTGGTHPVKVNVLVCCDRWNFIASFNCDGKSVK